ncbi:MAG: cobalamin-dependent protein [Planctomycetota bacterium]
MRELGMSLPGLRQRAKAIGQLPALGLLTLAGMTPPPWTCSYEEAPDDTLVDRLARRRPELVALSALTASVEEAYRLAHGLRRAGLRVVLGGLHATACPEEASRHVDAVIAGEGEPVWRQVLDDALAGSLRPLYRATAPYELAVSPVPRFDLLRGPRPRVTLQTQRGCPLNCEFCGASRLLGTFREKPIESIRRELHALAMRAPEPLLELADDNTFAGSRDVEPLFEALAVTGARYFTEADWRIGERADVLSGLAASGCVQVLVGLESQVYRLAGMGPKQAEWSRVRDAIQRIQEAGVAVAGCFIVGCDGEDRGSLERLKARILESPLADVQLTLQTPFPGTALYRRLKAQGRLLPGRGWSHYTLFDVTYEPLPMSVEELETGFLDLVRETFSPSAAARRTEIRKEAWRRNPRPAWAP